MTSPLAPRPPLAGPLATMDATVTYRVNAAALARPAAPAPGDPNLVLITAPDGDLVVYPPSDKLVILAARRR